jgi:hypothetical protein
MTARMRTPSAALLIALLVPAMTQAQGALGNPGCGYPTGQLSGAARGSGGATAEMDPNSPINPAALARLNRFSISLLFEPEFRRTSIGGEAESARIVRFPGFALSGGFRRFAFGASVSTLLDRSWTTQYDDSVLVGGEWMPSTFFARSDGAMSDSRLAVAYRVGQKLQLGAGYHAILGDNRATFAHDFADSSGNVDLTLNTAMKFEGTAWSIGAVAQPVSELVIAASARFGGALRAELEGSPPPGEGTVPSRMGVGVTWLGIPGTSLNARYDRTTWSDMDGLGSDSMSTFDATEYGFGVDVLGPRIAGVNSVVRVGLRDRTLPFGVDGNQVAERAFSAGLGVPIARGRAQFDVALERAARTVAGARERSWFFSIGIGIRP